MSWKIGLKSKASIFVSEWADGCQRRTQTVRPIYLLLPAVRISLHFSVLAQ